jgi:hypothetical protein
VKYYDHVAGQWRLKRRYVWSLWSFGAGLFAGIVLVTLLAR